uniref:NAD(P)-binding domain-containing protein n=1 Tax=Palpitomonas bilix TaxID=652834 RepID=A0A7S3DAZ7_9EUKA|mmetsp:Transcript_29898/g.77178  ORF Transcript_29898/g.77178 Transcript_29898/m.77178 type:complete len:267 (+) Transcript_29898:281-1081(+)
MLRLRDGMQSFMRTFTGKAGMATGQHQVQTLSEEKKMKCILFGGSGDVGGAVARALIKSDVCSELTMLGRRAVPSMEHEAKVRQVVVDTSSADFEKVVTERAQGHDIAISCIGIGSGTAWMSEEQMLEVEVHMLGKFARGCKAAGIETFELLTAVGVTEASANSRIKGLRVMGKKLQTVLDVGFEKLAVFKPGMILGNSHTPKWVTVLTSVIPDSFGWGNIHQEEVARAFVAHLQNKVELQTEPVVSYGNQEMKILLQEQGAEKLA